MSEVQRPIEETPLVPAAEPVAPVSEPVVAPTVAETPATVEPTTAATAATETPVVTSTDPAQAIAGTEAKTEETKPVEEGTLGYKAPGLIKSLIFSRKFFWFGSDAVETKNLAGYLRGEKPEHGNHNAAWASHTGKGLMFFSKKSTEKANPAGVINLSSITSEVTPEGPIEFHFMLEGQKHTFQSNTALERDSWVSALKAKIAEAKEMAESVTNHETYKKTHDTLSKPVLAGAAAVAPKKSEEKKLEKIEKNTDKKEDKAVATAIKKEEKLEKDIAKADKKEDKIIDTANKKEAKEEKKEEKAVAKADKKEDKAIDTANKKEAKEEKKEEKADDKTRKSRSQSRKRASIFGSIAGLGKKEEKTEEKKEEPIVETPGNETTATAPHETPLASTEATHAERPAPAQKRSSIFGTLKSQFAPHKEKKAEPEAAAPAVPAKDTVAEPVSETAPVIPAVETTEPLATSVASPATVPTEAVGDLPATNGESRAAEAPAMKTDKRKSSLPWLNKKEKTAASDEEGEEKPLSPFAKLRQTVKGKSSPKAAEKKEEKAEEKKEEKAAESSAAATEPKTETPVVASETAPTTSEPAVSEPVTTAPVTTPQVSATA